VLNLLKFVESWYDVEKKISWEGSTKEALEHLNKIAQAYIDGFDDIINMNIDGNLQEVTRIRKLQAGAITHII
jgi:hypothetical protein